MCEKCDTEYGSWAQFVERMRDLAEPGIAIKGSMNLNVYRDESLYEEDPNETDWGSRLWKGVESVVGPVGEVGNPQRSGKEIVDDEVNRANS